uniref:Reverse transcriptase domain-containing protein n=1 Tax=Lepisosteus oculatus TaxID=7918 RepID=W5NKD0_LEPOC
PDSDESLDEPAFLNGSNDLPIMILLPNDDQTCAICKEKIGRPRLAQQHYINKHHEVSLEYQCSKCNTTNKNLHSIQCHLPKCKGETDKATKENEGKWNSNFQTKSGLSQHKRHAHPDTRNNERITELNTTKNKETKYKGAKNINQLIAQELGTQNNKQVGEKRPARNRKPLENLTASNKPNPPAARQMTAKPPTYAKRTGIRSKLKRLSKDLINREETEPAIKEAIYTDSKDPITIKQLIEIASDKLLQTLKPKKSAINKKNKKPSEHQKGKEWSWTRKRANKRRIYKYHQSLYNKNKSKLASLILDGSENASCKINIEEIYSSYKKKWEERTAFPGLNGFTSKGRADNEVFESLISEEEIQENIKAIKRTSALGPDNIDWHAIQELESDGVTLVQLFNLWLIKGHIPNKLKQCKTILIPKISDEKSLEDIGNWRPITIGSMLLRLFSRIITKRLEKACPINQRQRGFRASGCSENLATLQYLLENAKKSHKQIAVVFIDIAKAFDSVSHDHIFQVLRQKELDNHIINLIEDSYQDCRTIIKTENQSSNEIFIKVGVKQGDPLSPILFNLAMDPLINALEELGCGFKTAAGNISTLAFADDLVLLSDNWEGMKNINILEDFCAQTGLMVQAKKCHRFLISPTKDSYDVNNCEDWSINGNKLHMITPTESEKYLELKISPWSTAKQPEAANLIQNWIQKIDKVPLKPSQKVNILNIHAITRLIYQLDHTDAKQSALMALDGTIRKAVKAWLRLPESTCNGLIYSSTRDGGLGIIKLASLIPSIQIRLQRMAMSSDATISSLMQTNEIQEKFQKLWTQAGGDLNQTPQLSNPASLITRTEEITLPDNWDPNHKQKPKYKTPRNWRKDEYENWTKLPVQGTGISNFQDDPDSNSWLSHQTGFKERHFIAALQLRANVYPTRECLNRGQRGLPTLCHNKVTETCSRILGQCPSVQNARIKRHNKICDILADEAKKNNWEIRKEPHFRLTNKLRKPDLIFSKDKEAIVIDVTIRFEHNELTLEKAAREKEKYYHSLKDQVKDLTGAENVTIFGFPIGARGKWFARNYNILHRLEIGEKRQKQLAKLFSRRALLYSLDMLSMFGGKSA